jgi:tetrahydromethanopterin S-methyltransferase subunit F
MEEIWKKCHESKECFYEVSNKGNIRSVNKESNEIKLRKTNINIDRTNYKSNRVSMRDINGKTKTFIIAHLVAYCFLGERPDGLEIDHINRDSLDNTVENLRYVSRIENARNTSKRRTDILEQDQKKRDKIIIKECRWKQAVMYKCECGKMTNIQHQSRHRKTIFHQNFLS